MLAHESILLLNICSYELPSVVGKLRKGFDISCLKVRMITFLRNSHVQLTYYGAFYVVADLSDMTHMSRFEFMSGIDDCLSAFDAPIVHGPVPRWQRKSLGKRIYHGSVPLSPCNDSRTTKTPIRTPSKCKTPLKTPRKTPQKTPAKTTTPLVDRFIPNRATMYNDKNYFQLVNDIDSEMQLDQIGPENLEKFYYQKTMKDNLEQAEDASESKILHFQHRPPEPREGIFKLYYMCKNNSTCYHAFLSVGKIFYILVVHWCAANPMRFK